MLIENLGESLVLLFVVFKKRMAPAILWYQQKEDSIGDQIPPFPNVVFLLTEVLYPPFLLSILPQTGHLVILSPKSYSTHNQTLKPHSGSLYSTCSTQCFWSDLVDEPNSSLLGLTPEPALCIPSMRSSWLITLWVCLCSDT